MKVYFSKQFVEVLNKHPRIKGVLWPRLIQHIKLVNEGWERDPEVVEPSEPSLS